MLNPLAASTAAALKSLGRRPAAPCVPFGTWLLMLVVLAVLITSAYKPRNHPAVTTPGTPTSTSTAGAR